MIAFASALACAALAPEPRPAFSPAPTAAVAPALDLKGEHKQLVREFDEALEAHREAGAQGTSPVLEFLPKFRDLAERGKGTNTGARALLWIVSWAPADRAADADAALGEILSEYAGDKSYPASLGREMIRAAYLRSRVTGREAGLEALGRIAEASAHEEVRVEARFAVVDLLLAGGAEEDRERAIAALRNLQRDFDGTAVAERARGQLFEAEHLQVGMVAPEFTSFDENGVSFKVSDYRGKVVVLDFWGKW